MSVAEVRRTLWSDVVNGLLDARADLATGRFDAELTAAVEAGELSAATAHRLRFWQRASVNAADDHARVVLPAVLEVLECAREQGRSYVDNAGAALAEAGPGPDEPTTEHLERALNGSLPVGTVLEDLRRASTSDDERPSTLVEPPSRLFVADLRDVPVPSERL